MSEHSGIDFAHLFYTEAVKPVLGNRIRHALELLSRPWRRQALQATYREWMKHD